MIVYEQKSSSISSPAEICNVYSVDVIIQEQEGGDLKAMSAYHNLRPDQYPEEVFQMCTWMGLTYTTASGAQWKLVIKVINKQQICYEL